MRVLFDDEELGILRTSTARMTEQLQQMEEAANEPQEETPFCVIQVSGTFGRPRIDIDDTWLEYALRTQGITHIASVLGVGPRTVRRRAVEYGLSEPGPSVIQYEEQADGTQRRVWRPQGPIMSPINDDPGALDSVIEPILESFPYGIQYIRGALRSEGHCVAVSRIRESFTRIQGLTPRFVHQPIARRTYSVRAVNSLWHHDGDHSKTLSLYENNVNDSNRADHLEVYLPCFHRWEVPFRHRCTVQYEQ
jgi:hypothetical protein